MGNNTPAFTYFLPAERATAAAVRRQQELIGNSPLPDVLDGIVDFVLILNRQRQTIYANKSFRDFLAVNDITRLFGQRPGGLADCTHAAEPPNGCGTTEACLRCGAGQAIAKALDDGTSVMECRIMSRKAGEDLNLRVCVKPFEFKRERLLLMSLADISAEKLHEALERVFFHDILNTAGAVKGLINLIDPVDPARTDRYMHSASDASDKLIEQILSQKDLLAAEKGTLAPHNSVISSREFLGGVAMLFAGHEAQRRKKVAVDPASEDVSFSTDKTLLLRVLVNMLKNALEAEKPGAIITLACRRTGAGVLFSVHNPGRMPDDTRYQVFQKSFSTKGAGRGLGTYSIRLLTEKYLKGKVSFTTGAQGTTFTVELIVMP
ncbi:MAG: HAMP domain-containing sensor histidine kinase [Elusimicrobia bacterium]|nr:HAMP domain-containing sensor histidine kinase [Elusimicrobiota bacterium]